MYSSTIGFSDLPCPLKALLVEKETVLPIMLLKVIIARGIYTSTSLFKTSSNFLCHKASQPDHTIMPQLSYIQTHGIEQSTSVDCSTNLYSVIENAPPARGVPN